MYLDYAATTPIDPRVIDYMIDVMKNHYGNSLSKHYDLATDANGIIEKARKQVASLISADANSIIFTSGASEGNNMVLKGIADLYGNDKNHIVTSKVEHKSIINTCEFLESRGFDVTYLDVDENGLVDLSDLESAINEKTILVSIMWVNNETGSINDIDSISKICKKHEVFYHVDITQGLGKLPLDITELPIDFATFTAHKIYGPKGIGGVYIGTDSLGIRHKLTPLIHGGKQEFSLRGTTHATHDIAGFGLAAEIMRNEYLSHKSLIKELDDELINLLHEVFEDVEIICENGPRLHGIMNIRIPNFSNEMFLGMYGSSINCSTGSACTFGEPSHVINSINKESDFSEYLRLSFNHELENAKEIVDALKEFHNDYC